MSNIPYRVTLTAPEKVWLNVSDVCDDLHDPFPAPGGDITWSAGSPATGVAVEYIRADLVQDAVAAIAKARGEV